MFAVQDKYFIWQSVNSNFNLDIKYEYWTLFLMYFWWKTIIILVHKKPVFYY